MQDEQDNQTEQDIFTNSGSSNVNVPATLLQGVLTRLHLNEPRNEVSTGKFLADMANADWQTRIEAIQTLGKWDNQALLEPLLVALKDDDESVRTAAIHALGKQMNHVAHEHLAQGLYDPSWLVREMAILTLGEQKDPSLVELLYPALEDENMLVRETAQLTLQQISPQQPFSSNLTTQTGQTRVSHVPPARHFQPIQLFQKWSRFPSHTNHEQPPTEAIVREQKRQQNLTSGKRFTVRRVIEGLLTACVIVGVILSWFVFTRWFHPTPIADSVNTPLWTYQGSMPSLRLQWTPNSQALTLLGLSTGTSVTVWERATGQLHTYNADILNAVWSPNGQYLSTVTEQPATPTVQVQVWNAETGQTVLNDSYVRRSVQSATNTSNGTYATLLAWSADSSHIAVASGDGTVQTWSIPIKQPPVACYGQVTDLLSLTWANNGHLLLSALADGTMQICDTTTGQSHVVFKNPATYTAALSPNGKYIAASINQAAVQIWDVTTDTLLFTYQGQTGGISQIQWLPDSRHVLSRVSNRFQGKSNIQIWDALTGHPILSTLLANHSMWELSPNGRYVATEWTDQKSINVWDTTSGLEVRSIHVPFALLPFSVAWSPNNQTISVIGATNTIEIWNPITGKELHAYQSTARSISLVLWDSNGQYLVTVGSNATITIDANGDTNGTINGPEQDTIQVWQIP